MRRSRTRLAGACLGGGVLLALGACLEAPSLDECYSARDCPTAMACNQGFCGEPFPSTDGGFSDGPGDVSPPDVLPPDMLPPDGMTPDRGPPPTVVCEARRDDDGALAYEILHSEAGAGAVRVDAVPSGDRIAVIWQGPERVTRVACYAPDDVVPDADALLYGGGGVEVGRPSIVHQTRPPAAGEERGEERLIAAWIQGEGEGTELVVRGFDPACGEDRRGGASAAAHLADVQLTATPTRLTLATRYNALPTREIGQIHVELLGPGDVIAPGEVEGIGDTLVRSFAIADDGLSPAYALVSPFGVGPAQRDGFFVQRYGQIETLTLSEGETRRVYVDGLVPLGQTAFMVTWRMGADEGDRERHLAEVVLDGGRVRLETSKHFATVPGELDQPADLAFDEGLGRSAVVTADDGTVRFWSLDARDERTPSVELELVTGENPAIVVLGRGDYGVLYSTHLDGLTYLKLARVTCTAPVPQ